MNSSEAIQNKIEEAKALLASFDKTRFDKWHRTTTFLLTKILPADMKEQHLIEFSNLDGVVGVSYSGMDWDAEERACALDDLKKSVGFLESLEEIMSIEEMLPSRSNTDDKSIGAKPGINVTVINNNDNQLKVSVNVSLQQIIKTIQNLDITEIEKEEAKKVLGELEEELGKPEASRNWDTIKKCLIWALNFGKDLFLKLLPIILQSQAGS